MQHPVFDLRHIATSDIIPMHLMPRTEAEQQHLVAAEYSRSSSGSSAGASRVSTATCRKQQLGQLPICTPETSGHLCRLRGHCLRDDRWCRHLCSWRVLRNLQDRGSRSQVTCSSCARGAPRSSVTSAAAALATGGATLLSTWTADSRHTYTCRPFVILEPSSLPLTVV